MTLGLAPGCAQLGSIWGVRTVWRAARGWALGGSLPLTPALVGFSECHARVPGYVLGLCLSGGADEKPLSFPALPQPPGSLWCLGPGGPASLPWALCPLCLPGPARRGLFPITCSRQGWCCCGEHNKQGPPGRRGQPRPCSESPGATVVASAEMSQVRQAGPGGQDISHLVWAVRWMGLGARRQTGLPEFCPGLPTACTCQGHVGREIEPSLQPPTASQGSLCPRRGPSAPAPLWETGTASMVGFLSQLALRGLLRAQRQLHCSSRCLLR